MTTRGLEVKDKLRKLAIEMARRNRWEEAVAVNRSILRDFPRDLEAYNRLGKALIELGRNSEARKAFGSALDLSPNNIIAKRHMARLRKLADSDAPRTARRATHRLHNFIEESGKASVTTLTKLASASELLRLTPGSPVHLDISGSGLSVSDGAGTYIGQVEPRVGSRIARLMQGGNRYEADITSLKENELAVIIRETYKSPTQAGIVSFPPNNSSYPVYIPSDDDDDEVAVVVEEAVTIKDWSDDDTEPGDDEEFTPIFHSIVGDPNGIMDDDGSD